MKKILLLCSILLGVGSIFADPNPSQITDCYERIGYCQPACGFDRTFLFTRPVYRNIGAQYAFWHDLVFNRCSNTEFSMQVMPIYSDSLPSKAPKRYFLYDDKLFLTVKGDQAAGSPFNRDIRAEWIGLPTDFEGGFTVEPSQLQYGAWIEMKANVRWAVENPLLEHLWVGFAAPIQWVENDIGIKEATPVNAPPDPAFPQNVTEALSNPAWRYAKFGPKQKTGGFGEFMFKVGTNFFDQSGYQFGTYSLFVLPAAKTENSEFLFSPYVGNNRHFGFGQGITFQIPLNNAMHCRLVSWYFYIENIFLIRNFQMRTFDLKNKPYSRYLKFVNINGQRDIPGVNVLTREVRVRPYNMADLSTGFRYQECGLEVNVSYNLWMRSEQRIKLRHCFPKDTFGIQGEGFIGATGIPATASASDIQEKGPNDVDFLDPNQEVFKAIDVDDFRLDSAGSKGTLNHRAQLSIGYLLETSCAEFLIGLGGLFEVPQFDTDLKRWGVWAKFGFGV